MLNFLKYLNPFRKPTADHMRAVLLEEAERLAITHAADAELFATKSKQHTTMAAMCEARARRLRKQIGG